MVPLREYMYTIVNFTLLHNILLHDKYLSQGILILIFHIQCQASIDTLSLCRGHSWRVRVAKQETLTPPGHLVSPLVCRGPWMSTAVLHRWCHSDSASVLLYFTSIKSFCDPLKMFYVFYSYSGTWINIKIKKLSIFKCKWVFYWLKFCIKILFM